MFVIFGRSEAAAIFLSSESWYREPGTIAVHVHYFYQTTYLSKAISSEYSILV